jgi:glycosyltransferase involved in cell wall biosynthesis
MEQRKLKHRFVLITSSNFPIGGAGANYLNLFCKGLFSNDISVHVYLLKGFAFGNYSNNGKRRNVTEYGVPYNYLSFKKRPENIFLKLCDEFLSILSLIKLLFSLLRHRKSTTLLVYNNELQSNIPIYLLAKLFRIKIVTFVPEFYDKAIFKGSIFRKLKWYGFLLNFYWLNRMSDKLIVFSHFLKDEYLKRGFKLQDIYVQPNLTDFEFWKTTPEQKIFTVGYSGTPSIKDGLFDLFKAISILKNGMSDVRLLVIGDSTFGKSLIPDLKAESQKLGISERVTYTGLVELSMVKKHLSECKILAITRQGTKQTRAGFPTKLGEYFATGRPVLSTNFGDIEKYFTDDVDLVMAESGNPESIAQKIKWMIENEDRSEIIAQTGCKKAKDLLDYNKSVVIMIQFINN